MLWFNGNGNTMKTFEVELERMQKQRVKFNVKAETEEEAENIAIDESYESYDNDNWESLGCEEHVVIMIEESV
mgnify:FL=1